MTISPNSSLSAKQASDMYRQFSHSWSKGTKSLGQSPAIWLKLALFMKHMLGAAKFVHWVLWVLSTTNSSWLRAQLLTLLLLLLLLKMPHAQVAESCGQGKASHKHGKRVERQEGLCPVMENVQCINIRNIRRLCCISPMAHLA